MKTIHLIAEKNVSITSLYNSLVLAAFSDVIASLPSLFAEICVWIQQRVYLCPFHRAGKRKECASARKPRIYLRYRGFLASTTFMFITSIPHPSNSPLLSTLRLRLSSRLHLENFLSAAPQNPASKSTARPAKRLKALHLGKYVSKSSTHISTSASWLYLPARRKTCPSPRRHITGLSFLVSSS